MDEPIEVDLNNIANGAALTEFQESFKKVMENIADIRTKDTAKRKITLVFDIVPKDRASIDIKVFSEEKLAKREGAATRVYASTEENDVAHLDMNEQYNIPEMEGITKLEVNK